MLSYLRERNQHLEKLKVNITADGVVSVLFRDEKAGGLLFGLSDQYYWQVDWALVAA